MFCILSKIKMMYIFYFLGDSVKVDESLFEEIDDLDIGDEESSDES